MRMLCVLKVYMKKYMGVNKCIRIKRNNKRKKVLRFKKRGILVFDIIF